MGNKAVKSGTTRDIAGELDDLLTRRRHDSEFEVVYTHELETLAAASDEIRRLRGVSSLLARRLCGISPDSNTQTEAEVADTERAIHDAIQEALQFHA